MGVRSGCALVIGSLAVAFAACDSGERETATSTSAETTTVVSTAAAESTTTAAETEDEPEQALAANLPRPLRLLDGIHAARGASTEEFEWLGEYNRWWADMSSDLALVARESGAIAAGGYEGAELASDIRQALDRLARCKSEMSRTLFGAPTKRLRRLYDVLSDACFAVEQVADSGLQMVLYGGSTAPRASWPREWRAAARLLYQAYRRVAAYDPALAPRLPTLGGVSWESRIEPLFSRVASRLAAKRVNVQCWAYADWPELTEREHLYTSRRITAAHAGFATLGGDVVNLSPDACSGLVVLAYLDARPTRPKVQLPLAFALDALSHEPLHSRGIGDEAVTECFALQRIERTARLLGIERAYARRLAEVGWKQGYGLEPPGYRSPECRDGGALDLRPDSSRWPS